MGATSKTPETVTDPAEALQVLGELNQSAQVARLFHRRYRESLPDSVAILRDALLTRIRQRNRSATRPILLLLTGAGLLRMDHQAATSRAVPDAAEFAGIINQARQIAQDIYKQLELVESDPDILVGIDIRTGSTRSELHSAGQFAALLTPAGHIELVLKGLARSGEYVYVPPKQTHLLRTSARSPKTFCGPSRAITCSTPPERASCTPYSPDADKSPPLSGEDSKQ